MPSGRSAAGLRVSTWRGRLSSYTRRGTASRSADPVSRCHNDFLRMSVVSPLSTEHADVAGRICDGTSTPQTGNPSAVAPPSAPEGRTRLLIPVEAPKRHNPPVLDVQHVDVVVVKSLPVTLTLGFGQHHGVVVIGHDVMDIE